MSDNLYGNSMERFLSVNELPNSNVINSKDDINLYTRDNNTQQQTYSQKRPRLPDFNSQQKMIEKQSV
jgi:hypothetical protein